MLEAYRHIHLQLRMATNFRKILTVSGAGRVEVFTG